MDWMLTNVIVPGVSNASCLGLLAGQSCLGPGGLPYRLTRDAIGGTIIELLLQGVVTDNGANPVNWTGHLTAEFTNFTPDVSFNLLSSPSGQFVGAMQGAFLTGDPVNAPEPASLLLIGGGLLLASSRMKKRRVH